ncbi:neuroguidin [Anaeramoeba ignava]|uniref:Neuroguidin n=1 Tax=Anaeramoeba ignava TaxID=1746090 RepID=A0A9Q0RFD4_ANAIG|nr:neuroguidin [Anaeramoeba ignava]
MMLDYCINLIFLVFFKMQGISIQNHPLIDKMIQQRIFIEKIEPIEYKIKYQIDKLIKTSIMGNIQHLDTKIDSNLQKEMKNELQDNQLNIKEQDPLAFKPRPSDLISKIDENEEDSVYRISKISAYLDPREAEKARRKRKLLEKKAQKSSILKDLKDQFSSKPREISGVTQSSIIQKEIANREREIQNYEEENFVRYQPTKAEKKEQNKLEKKLQKIDKFDKFRDLEMLAELDETEKYPFDNFDDENLSETNTQKNNDSIPDYMKGVQNKLQKNENFQKQNARKFNKKKRNDKNQKNISKNQPLKRNRKKKSDK